MKIYLVRHGESTSDIKQKYDGDYDDHLTKHGRKEAETIAKKLLDKKIEIIFSSSKIRAMETSAIISNKIGCQTKITINMAEQDIYGAFLELGKNQPEEEYRKLGEIIADQNTAVDGVETYEHFKKRVINSFNEIMNSKYNVVAIITHGGPIRCIFRDLLKLGELKKISNGAIIELEKNNSVFKVTNMGGVILN